MSTRLQCCPTNTSVGTGKREESGEVGSSEQSEDGEHRETLWFNFDAKEGHVSQAQAIS